MTEKKNINEYISVTFSTKDGNSYEINTLQIFTFCSPSNILKLQT